MDITKGLGKSSIPGALPLKYVTAPLYNLT